MLKLNIEAVKPTLRETQFPKVVIFESSTYCNLECTMCPQSRIGRINQSMDFELYKSAADEIAREAPDTEVWYAIMGEPLAFPGLLLDMIKHAKSLGIGNLNLNTNGCLLNSLVSQQLIGSGISRITVGIDATDAKTYGMVRRNGDFARTEENFLELLRQNASAGCPVEIIAQFIVMDENNGQQDAFRQKWTGKGATVKIRPKLGWGTAVESNQLYLSEAARDFPCPWIIRTMSIHVDGQVAQCDADWDDKHNVANIRGRTLKSIWNDELKTIRDRHWQGDFAHEPCSKCKDWQAGRSYIYRGESAQ